MKNKNLQRQMIDIDYKSSRKQLMLHTNYLLTIYKISFKKALFPL